MSHLIMRDAPGRLPAVATMRTLFERTVKDTEALNKKFHPLETREEDGQFAGYVNADADSHWVGFALGLRCAQRHIVAGIPLA